MDRSLPGLLRKWFDGSSVVVAETGGDERKVDWLACLPFLLLHLACLGVFFVGFSWTALGACLGFYLVRMFAITGFYHRYFSHRTYRTSRPFQFLMAIMGCSTVQCGPLWWSAHHRVHHAHSDQPGDKHSPRLHGFFWSHVGWFMSPGNFRTDYTKVKDLARYPELLFLNRFFWIVPLTMALTLFGIGTTLKTAAPGLGVTGMQLVIWGFFISTVILFHATYTINSLSHQFGRRRYATGDDSRNNFWLALLTLGEGWHNNHHHYPGSVRQGFYWWEIDITWYGLKSLSWLGLIWDLRPVPAQARERNRLRDAAGETMEPTGADPVEAGR